MTTTTPQDEERAARKRLRDLERARKKAEAKRAKEADAKLRAIIREVLASPIARECECGITTRTTRAEIAAMGAGCTAGQWVCPCLDAIRRRLDR